MNSMHHRLPEVPSWATTPMATGSATTADSSPPPLFLRPPSQATPPFTRNDENVDSIFLPVIPDDLDDDYLFSENSTHRTPRFCMKRQRYPTLPFRPRQVKPQSNVLFLDAQEVSSSCQRRGVLMPRLDGAPQDHNFLLPMNESKPWDNPVSRSS